jgi:steroid 5-alpha reductase family enzyme
MISHEVNSILIFAFDSLVICAANMIFVWFWARRIKNAGVVDIFWSYNFPVIAIYLFLCSPGFEPRKFLIFIMVVIAGLRLGTHILIRTVSHLHEEEGRYKQLRNEWSPNPDKKFFWFFLFQAISNVVLATPFFLIALNYKIELSFFEYTGAVLWLISVLGEATADAQLSAFKKDPANKGKVCDKGLWGYSRHPNYFFEWLMWVSYFVFALGSPYGYIAIISPAIILYLLLKVTGIPMTEEQSIRSKGDAFRAYQKRVSAFVPWFRKGVVHSK